MHDSVRAWVADRVARHRLAPIGPVLEVGSLDVNGSVRDLFEASAANGGYTGLDMRPGPGVDLVASAHSIPFGEDSFAVVVCTEVLEHDPAFWRTLTEIRRVLAPGGHLLLTTRGNGFGEHREPIDVFRFMPDAIPVLAELAGCDVIAGGTDPEVPGIFLHGFRYD